jgi:hypothetical protein
MQKIAADAEIKQRVMRLRRVDKRPSMAFPGSSIEGLGPVFGGAV